MARFKKIVDWVKKYHDTDDFFVIVLLIVSFLSFLGFFVCLKLLGFEHFCTMIFFTISFFGNLVLLFGPYPLIVLFCDET